MRRLIRHDSIFVRYRRLIHSPNSCLTPTTVLGALNLCLLFTLILMILFIFSLSLILLLFVNVTHLHDIQTAVGSVNSSSQLEWSTFVSKHKYNRRSNSLTPIEYSNHLSNDTRSRFDILQHPLVSQNNCSNFAVNHTNLVIVIHSACNHSTERQLMRQQINSISSSFGLSYLFVLGASSNQSLMNDIRNESRRYGDILELQFMDTYQNLTFKHMSSLRWPLERCIKADMIVKLDDDAFIDLRALLLRIGNMKNITDLIGCSQFPENTPPKRGNSKWALSIQEYPYSTYPFYCSGVGYFLTPDVAFDLLDTIDKRSNVLPFIGIDDVFITGLVRSLLRPQPQLVRLNDQYEYKASRMRQWLNDPTDHCPSGVIIADIGDQYDRTELTAALHNKTNRSWLNAVKCHVKLRSSL